MGAYFVKNTLKYKIKSSNFGSQRLVTKSMVLTLLYWIIVKELMADVKILYQFCMLYFDDLPFITQPAKEL